MNSRLFVFFSFCLAAGIVAYFLGAAVVQRNSALPPRELPSMSEEVLLADMEPEEEPIQVEPEPVTSYQFGYDRGYRAFLEQQGVAVPLLKVARYTTLEEGELDDEQASKGYMDGYHRAGEGLYCPRCEYR